MTPHQQIEKFATDFIRMIRSLGVNDHTETHLVNTLITNIENFLIRFSAEESEVKS